jgi:hypothetical protein
MDWNCPGYIGIIFWFQDIKESDYFTERGEFRVDNEGSPTLLNCLMYKLSYYRYSTINMRGIRIRIILGSRFRVRIEVKSWNRIRVGIKIQELLSFWVCRDVHNGGGDI